MRLCVTVPRIGPYHSARLKAAAKSGDISVIETRRSDSVYDWDEVDSKVDFVRTTLFSNEDSAESSRKEIRARMWSALDDARPDVVAVTGWSFADSLAALQWCLARRIPAVVMSESQCRDAYRSRWKEALKGQVVRLFSAGLVGGQPHKDYLSSLGMQRTKIFLGYDVVDNQHFSSLSDQGRVDSNRIREEFVLPEKFFLASNRFIEKKNLFRLLEAYALYRKLAGERAWNLVLLGDGGLRGPLRNLCESLRISETVSFPGFRQYDELPLFYGLARAFVHASTVEQWGLVVNEAMAAGLPVIVSENCGCTRDLVLNGENGFTFNPQDVHMLANTMLKFSSGDVDVELMGKRSRELISGWTPSYFADNLWNAADTAIRHPSQEMTSRSRRALLDVMFPWSTC